MRRERGFTLLEVVVAFAILALSVSTLYVVYQQTLRAHRAAALERDALYRAEQLIANAGVTTPLTEFDETMSLDPEWTARTTVHRRAGPEGEPDYTLPAYDITVRVFPRATPQAHAVELATVKLALPVADVPAGPR